jgi:hypothetical protein
MSFAINRKSSSKMDKFTAKLFILFSLMVFGKCEHLKNNTENTLEAATSPKTSQLQPTILNKHSENVKRQSSDMEEFEKVLLDYAKDVINRDTINIVPGVYIQKKSENITDENAQGKTFDDTFFGNLKQFTKTHSLRFDLARATTATGRLFFFKGIFRYLISCEFNYISRDDLLLCVRACYFQDIFRFESTTLPN